MNVPVTSYNPAQAAALGGQQQIYGYGMPQQLTPDQLLAQQQQQLQQLRQQQYARALMNQQGGSWAPQGGMGAALSPILRALQSQGTVGQQLFGQPQQPVGGNAPLGYQGANYSGWPQS